MTKQSKALQAAALREMRQYQAAGYSEQSLLCDMAVIALVEDGTPERDAMAAVQVVWQRYFAVMPPV